MIGTGSRQAVVVDLVGIMQDLRLGCSQSRDPRSAMNSKVLQDLSVMGTKLFIHQHVIQTLSLFRKHKP